MPRPSASRLAVLGSPINHSLSPAIHRAAYEKLGLAWTYVAAEVDSGGLSTWMNSLDDQWRGLSLTMPLKREILPLLAARHPLVDAVGAANTVLMTENGPVGFNTDVFGIVAALRAADVMQVDSAHIFGSGATAASALVALDQLGARAVTVEARTVENGLPIIEIGQRLGIEVVVVPLEHESRIADDVDLVVSTTPGAALVNPRVDAAVRKRAVLFDVAYSPWPSPLARDWLAVGGRVVSGVEMLFHQAIGQVRVFLAGDPELVLDDEAAVLGAMRSAVP